IGLRAQLVTLAEPELSHGVLVAGYFPPADGTADGLTAPRDAMAKEQRKFRVDDLTMLGRTDAHTLAGGIETAGDELTCTPVMEGMQGLGGFDTGLTPPISMSATDHQAIDAQQIVEVKGSELTPVSDFLDPDGKVVGQ